MHWSQRYLLDNSLPASALDLLDASAAAICAHQTSDILTKEDVAGVLSDRQGVEKDYLLKNETQIIEYCMTTLSHRICGQRVALNAIEKPFNPLICTPGIILLHRRPSYCLQGRRVWERARSLKC